MWTIVLFKRTTTNGIHTSEFQSAGSTEQELTVHPQLNPGGDEF
jgi:hypothetical protein